MSYPDAWPIEKGDVRKCLVHTFPFKILYSIEKDHIFIVVIFHQHRRPYYWVDKVLKLKDCKTYIVALFFGSIPKGFQSDKDFTTAKKLLLEFSFLKW